MPSPKDGKPGRLVGPAEPRKALEADDAVPGHDAPGPDNPPGNDPPPFVPGVLDDPVPPFIPGVLDDPDNPPPKTFLEIELLQEDGVPIPGEPFNVVLPDGRNYPGTLDENGYVRIDGIDPGSCQVTFPNLDARDYKKM